MSAAKKLHDDTVTLRPSSTVRSADVEANEMWLRERVVPTEYVDSVLGPSSESISLIDDRCVIVGNRVLVK
jgi:hypothetical protein